MKEETERLNTLVDWYKFKLDEIREAPVDSRPRKLSRLYQISEKNKHLGVTITRAGTLNLVDYPKYPPELKLHEYEDNEENPFYDAPTASSLPAGCKPCSQLDYFKKIIELIKADGIHSVEHGWNQRSPILSRELNYITIRKIIIFSLPWALWSRVAVRPHTSIYQSSNAYNQSP